MWIVLASLLSPALAGPTLGADLHAAVPVGRLADYDHAGVGVAVSAGYAPSSALGVEAVLGLDQFLGSKREGNSNDRAYRALLGPELSVGRVSASTHWGYGAVRGQASDYRVSWRGLSGDLGLKLRLTDAGPIALSLHAAQQLLMVAPKYYPPLGRTYSWTQVGLSGSFR